MIDAQSIIIIEEDGMWEDVPITVESSGAVESRGWGYLGKYKKEGVIQQVCEGVEEDYDGAF